MSIVMDEIFDDAMVAGFLGKDKNALTADDKFGFALLGLSLYVEEYKRNLPTVLTLEENIKAGIYAVIVQQGYFSSWSLDGYDCTVDEVEAIIKDFGFALDLYVYDDCDGEVVFCLAYDLDTDDAEVEAFWEVGYKNALNLPDAKRMFDAVRMK